MKTLVKFCGQLAVIVSCFGWAQGGAGEPVSGGGGDLATPESYLVRIPAHNLSCQAEADRLRDGFLRLAADPGISVTSARCLTETTMQETGHSFRLYQLKLSYEYKFIGPSFYNAHLALGSVENEPSMAGRGIYGSYRECLADITARTIQFTSATGLDVLAAHCDRGWAPNHARDGYILSLDTIGKPRARLYQDHFPDLGSQNRRMIQEIGRIFHNISATEVVWQEQEVLYYSPSNLPIRTVDVGLMSAAECDAQISTIRTFFNKIQAFGTYSVCSPSLGSQTSYWLYAFLPSQNVWVADSDSRGVKYFSFEECMAVKDEFGNSEQPPAFCARDTYDRNTYTILRLAEY